MMHRHKCPECYEAYPCDMKCTIESDIEGDGDGIQYGAYCKCDECEKSSNENKPVKITLEWFKAEAQKKNPTAQWWKIYNGTLR